MLFAGEAGVQGIHCASWNCKQRASHVLFGGSCAVGSTNTNVISAELLLCRNGVSWAAPAGPAAVADAACLSASSAHASQAIGCPNGLTVAAHRQPDGMCGRQTHCKLRAASSSPYCWKTGRQAVGPRLHWRCFVLGVAHHAQHHIKQPQSHTTGDKPPRRASSNGHGMQRRERPSYR